MRLLASMIVGVFLIARSAVGADVDRLLPHMNTTSPAGPEPFPAVLMMSGCNGFQEGHDLIKSQLSELGFLVVFVDSLAARGYESCGGGVVPRSEQLNDIRVVADYLRTRPNVKPDSTTVIGYSWGGGAAMAAAVLGDSIDGVIAYYPNCQNQVIAPVKIPTLALHGEADNVNSLASCSALYEASSELLELHIYADAHHVFNAESLDPPVETPRGTLAYNRAAATAAWYEVTRFLARMNDAEPERN